MPPSSTYLDNVTQNVLPLFVMQLLHLTVSPILLMSAECEGQEILHCCDWMPLWCE